MLKPPLKCLCVTEAPRSQPCPLPVCVSKALSHTVFEETQISALPKSSQMKGFGLGPQIPAGPVNSWVTAAPSEGCNFCKAATFGTQRGSDRERERVCVCPLEPKGRERRHERRH